MGNQKYEYYFQEKYNFEPKNPYQFRRLVMLAKIGPGFLESAIGKIRLYVSEDISKLADTKGKKYFHKPLIY